jgi:hypothetical protein
MKKEIKYDKKGNILPPNRPCGKKSVALPTATAEGVATRQAQILAENETEKTWAPEFPAENPKQGWLDARKHSHGL